MGDIGPIRRHYEVLPDRLDVQRILAEAARRPKADEPVPRERQPR